MKVSSIPAVTNQRAAAIKIQARVRGHQLRNKQLRNKQLLEAAESGDINRTKHLITHGADVNATDKYGNTALHWAAIRGPLEIVKLLLDRGADVNVTNKYGETALHVAGLKGHVEIVKLLLKAGADVNATKNNGRTALDLAKNFGHYDKVKNAIKEGKQKLISLYLSHVEKAAILSTSNCFDFSTIKSIVFENASSFFIKVVMSLKSIPFFG